MTKRNSTGASASKQAKKKYATEKFIVKAKAIHGERYCYDLVDYKGSKEKVRITCKEHGYFDQIAGNHLNGQNCPSCAKASRYLKTPEFIKKCIAVHGDKYDYSQTVYTGSKSKVEVYCKECSAVFLQVAADHARGRGCMTCHKKRVVLTREKVVNKFIAKHGDLYDYTDVVFTGQSGYVRIYCKRCKEYFEQSAHHHAAGSGCKRCHFKDAALTQDEFLERAKAVHGDLYCYRDAVYSHNQSHVTIRCLTCGDRFKQKPHTHIMGHGCPSCANLHKGYSRSKFVGACVRNNNSNLGFLYVVRLIGVDEDFYKIGITSRSLDERFAAVKLPYKYELVKLIEGEAEYIYDLETTLHRLLSDYRYTPDIHFAGRTECFSDIEDIRKLLRDIASTDQLQLIA